MKKFHCSRLIASAIVALMFSGSMTSSLDAKQGRGGPGNGAPFTGIVAFGDSLTDTGKMFELTGGCYPDPAFYNGGRFSNGPIWLEYLAQEMGIEAEAVENYAVGGATTGRDNSNDYFDPLCLNDEYPGLQDQIDTFEDDLDGKKADKRALYVVFAGGNDFYDFDPSQTLETISAGVGNTLFAVQRLHDAGARRIMVVNLPDLGLTPFGNGPLTAGFLSWLSAVYNGSLNSALDGLAATGVETIRMDASGVLQEAVSNPDDFGFSNVVDGYLPTGLLDGADPSEFLFWDPFHPTTRGHFLLAEEAMEVLREEFRHVWGTPRRR